MNLKKKPVPHLKKLTKSFIQKTISYFKTSAGLNKASKFTNENIDKMDEWFTHSNYDPKGVEGQIKIAIIQEYANFVMKNGTFSTKFFIDNDFNNLCYICYSTLVKDGYKEYQYLLDKIKEK